MHPLDGPTILDRMNLAIQQVEQSIVSGITDSVIYSFVGELNQDLIHSIVAEVEEKLLSIGTKKGQLKKTFTILVEGLQNAYIHGANSGQGKYLGLSIVQREGQIEILILGVTDEEQFTRVQSLVENLNSMEAPELKKHYLEVMTNGQISDKGGAGLGLITMVMKSSTGMNLEDISLADKNVLIQSRLTV